MRAVNLDIGPIKVVLTVIICFQMITYANIYFLKLNHLFCTFSQIRRIQSMSSTVVKRSSTTWKRYLEVVTKGHVMKCENFIKYARHHVFCYCPLLDTRNFTPKLTDLSVQIIAKLSALNKTLLTVHTFPSWASPIYVTHFLCYNLLQLPFFEECLSSLHLPRSTNISACMLWAILTAYRHVLNSFSSNSNLKEPTWTLLPKRELFWYSSQSTEVEEKELLEIYNC